MRRALACLALMLPAVALFAADKPTVTPPPPPEELTQGESVEPTVTIVERSWATIEEYSIDGRVYAVRVTPAVGRPYYFYDSDGDGSMETRLEVTQGAPEINRWKILTW